MKLEISTLNREKDSIEKRLREVLTENDRYLKEL